jgi:hypothetical protein
LVGFDAADNNTKNQHKKFGDKTSNNCNKIEEEYDVSIIISSKCEIKNNNNE